MAAETRKDGPGPGAALRAFRKRNGWTLADLSERTGMLVSHLSKIENGKIALTYDNLSRLAAALGVEMGQLVAMPAASTAQAAATSSPPGRRSIIRRGEGHQVDTPNYGHLYLAADLLQKRFLPLIVECRARTLEEFGSLISHPGDEFAYVLEGTLVLHTDIYAPAVLEQGDAIYFDSRMGHAYLNGGNGTCRVLSISTDRIESSEPAVGAEASATQPRAPTQLQVRGAQSNKRRQGKRP